MLLFLIVLQREDPKVTSVRIIQDFPVEYRTFFFFYLQRNSHKINDERDMSRYLLFIIFFIVSKS